MPTTIPPALRSRYGEPWRHYHTLAHIEAMERHLRDAVDAGIAIGDLPACRAFIWWHDAIYEPQAPPGQNEMRSAELCRAEMGGWAYDMATIERTAAMIEATAQHVPPNPTMAPDAPLMLDIDLSVLGASADTYDRYAHAIRREYSHVADQTYREARARILRGFLDRPALYLTDWALARWEEQARANLALEVAALTDAT